VCERCVIDDARKKNLPALQHHEYLVRVAQEVVARLVRDELEGAGGGSMLSYWCGHLDTWTKELEELRERT
jgi:hypothetical protein